MGRHQRAPRGERLQPVAHERLCELFLRAEQALQLAPDRGITVQRPVQPGEASQQCVVHRPGPDALQGQQVFGNDLGWRISLPLIERQAPLDHFARELMGPGVKSRFRTHFFPFTEPSVEVDFSCHMCGGKGCRVCKQSGWIEIMGAGMVDPNVFKLAGYDPEAVTGYAFGMGIERLAMILFGIDDIRRLYENDARYLAQF